MKVNPKPHSLTTTQINAIEQDLKVRLDKSTDHIMVRNQQFGVYDEDNTHAGNIRASELYFYEKELRFFISALNQGI